MMATVPRIKTVERNGVLMAAINGPTIGQSHRYNSNLIATALCLHFEPEQVAFLVAGEHLFHNRFYFFRRKLASHNVIFVRKQIPDVVQCFRPSGEGSFVLERAVHHAINWRISLQQSFADCRANESLYIAWHARTTPTPQRLGQFPHWR